MMLLFYDLVYIDKHDVGWKFLYVVMTIKGDMYYMNQSITYDLLYCLFGSVYL